MKFLVDANLPRSALRVFAEHGHTAAHVKDVGMGDAQDSQIAIHARSDGAVLVTRDLDFANVRAYPPVGTAGILVLRVPDDWISTEIVEVLRVFLTMEDLVSQSPDTWLFSISAVSGSDRHYHEGAGCIRIAQH